MCTPALGKLHRLEEEEPQLHVRLERDTGRDPCAAHGRGSAGSARRPVGRSGSGWTCSSAPDGIVYKETIAEPMEGVGHYEPLRHYAEVHLLLEPLPRGSGMQFDSRLPGRGAGQELAASGADPSGRKAAPWRAHRFAPLTDMKITLLAGRAHLKHTEGGDFRQATYRAVRQGLMMKAKSQLLEPLVRTSGWKCRRKTSAAP